MQQTDQAYTLQQEAETAADRAMSTLEEFINDQEKLVPIITFTPHYYRIRR